jgi:hypothetical protein
MADTTTSELRRKAAWLIAVRVVIGTILLGSAIVMQITAPGALPVDPFFFLIGLTYALTIGYALTLPFVETRRWLVDVQLAGDALIVTAFIYFTGGITSYFASLYVLPVVAGSTVQFRRGGRWWRRSAPCSTRGLSWPSISRRPAGSRISGRTRMRRRCWCDRSHATPSR